MRYEIKVIDIIIYFLLAYYYLLDVKQIIKYVYIISK